MIDPLASNIITNQKPTMPALAILGMHRSYTSLTARWLAACGIDIGNRLLSGDTGNSDGHFEDLDFYRFHRKVLISHGLPGNGMVNLATPQFLTECYSTLSIADELAREGRELLAAKHSTSQQWAWKEPRTCLMLEFYRRELDLRSLVLVRPYQEVVSSLVERELRWLEKYRYVGMRRPYYLITGKFIRRRIDDLRHGFLEAWIFYNRSLLAHLRASNPEHFIVADLQTLLKENDEILAKVQEWGFEIKHQTFADFYRPAQLRQENRFDPDVIERAELVTAEFNRLLTPSTRPSICGNA